MSFTRTLAISALFLAAGTAVRPASASGDEVSATGKGITGGALLGAEVVMLTEAAAKTRPAWAYFVGGVAGAAGGGVGGYFAEQQGTPQLSLYLLVGGMALAIPTTVAVLTVTSRDATVEYTEDAGPTDEPVAEPPQPRETVTPAAPATSRAPQPVAPIGFVGLDRRRLTLSVPAVEVRDLYTRRQVFELGVKQGTEWRIPVFSARF